MSILIAILLLSGTFFALTGAVGILRMPDFYSRLHPAGESDTLGATLILGGLVLEYFRHNAAHGDNPYDPTVAIKLILTLVCIAITAPTATHSITKAAHLDGLKPWSVNDAKTAKGKGK